MVGSELASFPGYLLDRAAEELSVRSRLSGWQLRAAQLFVRVVGVPELGVHLRIQHALRRLPEDVGSLIDLGCGAGMLLGQISRHKRFTRLVGIEVDAESAEIAKKTHPYAEIHQIMVQEAPAQMAEAFDCGVCIDVLEHLSDNDVRDFLEKTYQLLKPGGSFFVHVPREGQRRHFSAFRQWEHHDHVREGFLEDDLVRRLRDVGFVVDRRYATIGPFTSLCWELNMFVAGKPIQGLIFPPSLVLCSLYERIAQRSGNGILCIAKKPQ